MSSLWSGWPRHCSPSAPPPPPHHEVRCTLAFKAGESSLTRSVHDQAQLHGLLDRLGDLGIPLVSVNPVQ